MRSKIERKKKIQKPWEAESGQSRSFFINFWTMYVTMHGLRMPSEEMVFTERPKNHALPLPNF